MLWYKGWRETQFKLLLSLGFLGFWLVVFYSMRNFAPPPGSNPFASFAFIVITYVLMIYTWLAGAGIATQPSFQATKGLHGSTSFTLSLPVSRFRLLAVRAGVGWLEMTVLIGAYCAGMWVVIPVVRRSVTPTVMFQHAVALVSCASSLYFLSVLLATFLDDQGRMFGGMIAFGALWGLSNLGALPPSVDIVRAMIGGSPLVTHTMPWAAMAFSLGLTAILFFAALKIVQSREY
jgi:ABC-2 type transport system permease protein